MGRPTKDASIIKHALKQYADRESNRLTVSEIIKSTAKPKATLYAELKKLESEK